jgi:aspartyl-tRNA(Asn)/glutamyl-tRNA(Gln) amidotransferase subunit A
VGIAHFGEILRFAQNDDSMYRNLTINQAHEGLVKKKFSCEKLTQYYLDKIKKEDKKINAVITVTADLALEQAKFVDRKIALGEEIGLLEGVPCLVKDNILLAGVPATAGSKILENYVAAYDATVIKKLKEAGAVFLGKTNMDEFAMGSTTETSFFGPSKNPRDFKRVPGGSSGGSAAAVAADFCVFALGSDTGGSIRQPASFCGVTGLKPTYGAVSRYGLMAMASSLDQIGSITKCAEDAEIVFEAICGRDERDSTTADCRMQIAECRLQNCRIGLPKECFGEGLDSEVRARIREAAEKLSKAGAKIKEISLPHTDYALAVYYVLMPAEVSANLARYDGERYGYSVRDRAANLFEIYAKSRGEGFGNEVRRRIMLGTYVLSHGYYDAYYKKAMQVRTFVKRDFEKAFLDVDFILTPTAPTTAWKLGEIIDDPIAMYLSDIYTVSANVAGIPGLSVPCGEAHGLPVGLQILGWPFQEKNILNLAKEFEKL